ncbi:MAG: hypothetical protein IJA34_01115 [Lachnospiraceae bacterium]|nr:hypothetical protein [Lachnospiraceae bacterium]
MNKEISDFLRTVKISFPIFRKSEKRFYSDFRNSVNDYAENNPQCTILDLYNHFGSPKDIVITYYNNMDSDVYLTLMKKTRYIRNIFISVLVTLALLVVIATGFFIAAKLEYDKYSIDHLETTITEDGVSTNITETIIEEVE